MSDPTVPAEAQELLLLLDEQKLVFERMQEISAEESEAIGDRATDTLLRLARQKEVELSKNDDIEGRMLAVRDRYEAKRGELPDEIRELVQQKRDEVKDVLGKLISAESSSQAELNQHQTKTTENLRKIDGGRKIAKAYQAAPASRPKPRFVDKAE